MKPEYPDDDESDGVQGFIGAAIILTLVLIALYFYQLQ
jgi:hypothetical protein